jgi:hypothetical protein
MPSTPPRQPALSGEYIVNSPNALMLVDSQGRRTGKDPGTGTFYREIPSTSYGEEAVNPGHPNGELFTSDLPNGQYTLYVRGGKTGFYGLGIAINGRLTQNLSGNLPKRFHGRIRAKLRFSKSRKLHIHFEGHRFIHGEPHFRSAA